MLVTHDLVDAVAMADQLVVMQAGSVVQRGTPAEVTDQPRSTFIADLVGVTLLHGSVRQNRIAIEGGGELTVQTELQGPLLAIPPASASITREASAEPGPNRWRGTVGGVDLMGTASGSWWRGARRSPQRWRRPRSIRCGWTTVERSRSPSTRAA